MTEDEFKEVMLDKIRADQKQINEESGEKINKKFKIKEIKRLKEENKKTNFKIILGVGLFALAAAVYIWLMLDSKELQKEDIISKIYFALCVGIGTVELHILGALITQIIKKCKIKGIIEYLENIDKTNEDGQTLDEKFEEDMKGRQL